MNRDDVNTQEHPDMPSTSPDERLRLQAQSVRLQDALDAALLDVYHLFTERDMVSNRQADVVRSKSELNKMTIFSDCKEN